MSSEHEGLPIRDATREMVEAARAAREAAEQAKITLKRYEEVADQALVTTGKIGDILEKIRSKWFLRWLLK